MGLDQKSEGLHVGIDTSNYTTSVAAAGNNGEILFDGRIPLNVKAGERGLRQSDALFQHIGNLPVLIEALFNAIDRRLVRSIGVSSRPRPVDGSYMPVFKAGMETAGVMALSLDIPCFYFSHQEGHLEAIRRNGRMAGHERMIAFHLSGGTCEILKAECGSRGYDIEIIGGSRDISFGQIIDRVGVSMGIPFPAGKDMDNMAFNASRDAGKKLLGKIRLDGTYFNLSGLENQCARLIEDKHERSVIARALFENIGDTLCDAIRNATEREGINAVLLAGGVSASRFIRDRIAQHFDKTDAMIEFGPDALSSDNAVGTAFLAARSYGGNRMSGGA